MNQVQDRLPEEPRRPQIVHKTTIHHEGHAVNLHLPLKGKGVQLDSRESLLLAKLAILDAPFKQRTEEQDQAKVQYEELKERHERKKRRVVKLIKNSTEDSPKVTRALQRLLLRLIKTESFDEMPPVMLKDSGGWVSLSKLKLASPEFSELEFQNCIARLKDKGLLLEYMQSDGKHSWPEVRLPIRADVTKLRKLEGGRAVSTKAA